MIKVYQSDGWLYSIRLQHFSKITHMDTHQNSSSLKHPETGPPEIHPRTFPHCRTPNRWNFGKRRKNQLKPNRCQSNWWPQKTLNATTLFKVFFNIHCKWLAWKKVKVPTIDLHETSLRMGISGKGWLEKQMEMHLIWFGWFSTAGRKWDPSKTLLRIPAITSRHHHVERKRTALEACLFRLRRQRSGDRNWAEIPGGYKDTIWKFTRVYNMNNLLDF